MIIDEIIENKKAPTGMPGLFVFDRTIDRLLI